MTAEQPIYRVTATERIVVGHAKVHEDGSIICWSSRVLAAELLDGLTELQIAPVAATDRANSAPVSAAEDTPMTADRAAHLVDAFYRFKDDANNRFNLLDRQMARTSRLAAESAARLNTVPAEEPRIDTVEQGIDILRATAAEQQSRIAALENRLTRMIDAVGQ